MRHTHTVILLAAMSAAAGPNAVPAQSASVKDDVGAGRVAFVTAGCNECHQVSADPDLPAHAPAGPLLRGLGGVSTTDIAARITARSSSGSRWMEAEKSGMNRSTDCTTLQEVRKITIYLQAKAR